MSGIFRLLLLLWLGLGLGCWGRQRQRIFRGLRTPKMYGPPLSNAERINFERVVQNAPMLACERKYEVAFYDRIHAIANKDELAELVNRPIWLLPGFRVCNQFIGLICDHEFEPSPPGIGDLVGYCMCMEGMVWEPRDMACAIRKMKRCKLDKLPDDDTESVQLNIHTNYDALYNYNLKIKCRGGTSCHHSMLCRCTNEPHCPKTPDIAGIELIERTLEKYKIDFALTYHKRFLEYGQSCPVKDQQMPYRMGFEERRLYDFELYRNAFEGVVSQDEELDPRTCSFLHANACIHNICRCETGTVLEGTLCKVSKGETCTRYFWHRGQWYEFEAECVNGSSSGTLDILSALFAIFYFSLQKAFSYLGTLWRTRIRMRRFAALVSMSSASVLRLDTENQDGLHITSLAGPESSLSMQGNLSILPNVYSLH